MFNLQIDPRDLSPEEIVMLLLLLPNRELEQQVRNDIEKTGIYKCAITEVGANIDQIRHKVVNAVIGAAIDCGVITKTPHHTHAIIHASEEALGSIIEANRLIRNLGLKLAIVRDSQWLVVGMLGKTSGYHLSTHKRVGLGVMHITS